MITKDFLINNAIVAASVNAVVITADANGASVDLRGYDGCAFVALLGIEGDTLSGSVKLDLEMEDSADDSTFANCAVADVLDKAGAVSTGAALWGTIDANAEIPNHFIGIYIGTARYVRPVVNVTGSHSNGTPIAILAIRFRPDTTPAV